MKKKKDEAPRAPSRSEVKEIAQDIIREAFHTQARELEAHLRDIHSRIIALERKP
jgi:hypothetical protein